MRESAKRGDSDLDHADYISNSVVLKSTKNMGRGLFASKNIKAGELLMCSKAFKVIHRSRDDSLGGLHSGTLQGILQGWLDGMSQGSKILLRDCVYELSVNPSRLDELLQLYDGGKIHKVADTDEPSNKVQIMDGNPLIDSFLVRRILEHNGFACEKLSSNHRVVNSDTDTDQGGQGLWILPSYFNHSCYGNVYRSFISEMMIVRATKDIPEGEQLKLTYIDSHMVMALDERQTLLQKNWGFECRCELCMMEVQEGVDNLYQREKLDKHALLPIFLSLISPLAKEHGDPLEQLLKSLISPPDSAHMHRNPLEQREQLVRTRLSVEAIIQAFKDTYARSPPPQKFPRLHLAGAYLVKRKICTILGDTDGIVAAALGVLEACGYRVEETSDGNAIKEYGYCREYLVGVLLQMYWTTKEGRRQAPKEFAVGWKNAAKEMYGIIAGETASFEEATDVLRGMFEEEAQFGSFRRSF
ncbi:SET domain-containing protein [Wilcoxina mikolae CBS 423.85]|nr:SET domain-containing protein [Wilcoxina mikolae CBS 423.85]